MRPIGEKLVIATHNPGKLREIAALLEPLGIACVGAEELGLPEPEEIGNTFVDNADLKAREAADLSGLPALADDSGLCVDALHGLPGIFSARWAEDEDGNRDWHAGDGARLGASSRPPGPTPATTPISPARCRSPGPTTARPRAFEGRVDGTLVWPPRGDKGFGYDPMFVPAGHEQTFGEMDPAEKHRSATAPAPSRSWSPR